MSPENLPQDGPMVSGITPQEASERLNTFQVIMGCVLVSWLCTCRDSYQEFELESDKRKPSDNGLIEKWKKHITLRVRVLRSRGEGGRGKDHNMGRTETGLKLHHLTLALFLENLSAVLQMLGIRCFKLGSQRKERIILVHVLVTPSCKRQ